MKAIFLIRGPLHILNMLEAIKEFNISDAICFLYVSHISVGAKYEAQCKKLLKGNSGIKLITTYSIKNAPLEKRIEVYGKFLQEFKHFDTNFVFFTDPKTQWQKDIITSLKKTTYLMDEGAFSIIAYRLLKTRKKFFHLPIIGTPERRKQAIKIKKAYQIEEMQDYPYHFFTFLKSFEKQGSSHIVENKLTLLAKTWGSLDHKTHVIIGSNFHNTFNLDENKYVKLISKMLSPNKNNIYIPHPGASQVTQEKIKTALPTVKILNINEPVELWLNTLKSPPSSISSFYSSLICTINRCFPQINLLCYRLPEDIIDDFNQTPVWGIENITFSETIKWAYEYLEKNVTVCELKNTDDA